MAFEPVTVTPEQLAALDAEHDEVAVFRSKSEKSPWLVVCRRPDPDEAIAYKSMASDPAKKTLANVKLITRIAVHPKGEDFHRQFKRWPFFPDGLVDSAPFKEFVGLAVDDAEK
jgi:hypothetical protein